MNQGQLPPFAQSIRWQTVNVVTQVVLQLAFISLLARILEPADFGVMAIALVVVGFIEIFAQVGIGPSLIQRKDLSPQHTRTAFSFSLVLGCLFFGLMYLAAPWIGSFYRKELLVDVLRWISLSFILSSLAIVPRSLLIREMAFKKLFIAACVAMVIGNLVIGLGLAYSGAGIWSYVVALLCQNALLGLMYWILRPSAIGWKWHAKALRQMLGYGGRSTLFNVSNYAAGKADTLLVGHLAQNAQASGWSTTGLYDRSAYLMGLPISVLGKLGDSVLFSGMAALQEERAALQRVLTRAAGLISWLIFPASVLLIVFATDIAVLFLGDQYVAAGPVVRILFIGVAFRSLIKLGDAVVRAVDALSAAIAIKLLFLICVSASTYFALTRNYGIEGVAWGVTASTVVQFAAMGALILRTMQWDFRRAVATMKPGLSALLLAAIGCIAIDWLTNQWSPGGSNWEYRLVRVAGAGIWTACCMVFMACRFPELIDGNDSAVRERWLRHVPGIFKPRPR